MQAIIFTFFLTALFEIPAITGLQCAVCNDNSQCLEMLVAECPLGKNYQCVDAYNKPTLVYPKGQLQKSCMPKYYHCNVPNGICTNCLGDLCNLGTSLDYYYKKYMETLKTNHNDRLGSGTGKIIGVVVDDSTVGKGVGSNINNKHVNSVDYNNGNMAKVIRIKDDTTNNKQVDGTDNGRIIFIKDGTAGTKNNVNPDTSGTVAVNKIILLHDGTNTKTNDNSDRNILILDNGTASTKHAINRGGTGSTKGGVQAGLGFGNLGGISFGGAGGGGLASMLGKLAGLRVNIGSGTAGGTESGMNGKIDTINQAGGEFGEGKLITVGRGGDLNGGTDARKVYHGTFNNGNGYNGPIIG